MEKLCLIANLSSHGTFNRLGGVSETPYDTLNISHGVGDDPVNVERNRARIKKELELDTLVSARQVHGDKVLSIDRHPGQDLEVDGYDALITNLPGLGLMVQQADCQAVMIFDPVGKVVANVHSGWRGSVADIIGKTIEKMGADFGSKPDNLLAAISPSLGPCCAEFINYDRELPESLHSYQVKPDYFDFWAISSDQLGRAGVPAGQITRAEVCTGCDPDYFSYRREVNTGRFASVIGLP